MSRPCYHGRVRKADQPTAAQAESLGLPVRRSTLPKLVIGRREWIRMPELGIDALNAKTDSGARSSCLHAEDIALSDDGRTVYFHTRDHDTSLVACTAEVAGKTRVKSSTGFSRPRVTIFTDAVLPGGFRWRIRLTLVDRERMNCRMLLGRRAISGYFLIDTQRAHLCGGLEDF